MPPASSSSSSPPPPPPPSLRSAARLPPRVLVAMAAVGEMQEHALTTMVGWTEISPQTPHRWLVFVSDTATQRVAKASLPRGAEVRLLAHCCSPMSHGLLTALREARLEAAHAALPLLWIGAGVVPVLDPIPYLLSRHVLPTGARRRPPLAVAGTRATIILAPQGQLGALDRAITRAHDAFLRGAHPTAELALLRALRNAGVAILDPARFPELRLGAKGGSFAAPLLHSEPLLPRGAPLSEAEATPSAAKAEATPSAAKAEETPSAAKAEATPSAAKAEETPSAAKASRGTEDYDADAILLAIPTQHE